VDDDIRVCVHILRVRFADYPGVHQSTEGLMPAMGWWYLAAAAIWLVTYLIWRNRRANDARREDILRRLNNPY
jgi:hypothetical protein